MTNRTGDRILTVVITCSRVVLLIGLLLSGIKAMGELGPLPAIPTQKIEASRDAADMSGPLGTWYINANSFRMTAIISEDPPGIYQGYLIQASGDVQPLDNISWNAATRRLEYRLICTVGRSNCWQWYRGTLVEGIIVGRFSTSSQSPERPAQLTAYRDHFSGWNSDYLDQDIAPRVYELLVNNQYHARLRIDYADTPSGFAGRLKFYASIPLQDRGEAAEDDIEVTQWDGTNLQFTRRVLDPGFTQVYTGVATGRTIAGTFVHTGQPPAPWNGARGEVLGYSFISRLPEPRAAWQERTRRQLYHLMMAGNPMPLTRQVTVLRSNVPPLTETPWPPNRDDDPAHWPQNYRLTELQFDYTLPNPYDGPPIPRRSHVYLATPTTPPPAGGYPAVLAVNGHAGSAWRMMNPAHPFYFYGDAYARRGFVVLAVDISHRPVADRRGMYIGVEQGDDPEHGNGVHPSIKAPGFDSDWEEDGERAWDAFRALDYLLSLPNVDAQRVLVTGLSMGGEVASVVGALEPRLAMSIPGSYSPDIGLMQYRGHRCELWLNADLREYIDWSDWYALTAPRPLIVQTGKQDTGFSAFNPPYASDKQVARRSRAAYGDEVSRYIHYLHYDGHAYHFGDVNPNCPSCERGVYSPILVEPEEPWSLRWQLDGRTSTDGGTLFDYITGYLGPQ